jgi:hypothetical protein
MRRLAILVALGALGVAAVAGVAYAVTVQFGDGKDVFVEVGCQNDDVFGGGGRDLLYFNTSNEINCPAGDVDFGRGQQDNRDLVDASDPDTLDDIAGGRGARDTCIITVDQHGTADLADDSRDALGDAPGEKSPGGCERIKEVIYNPPPPQP